jgi:hypothetical protein
VSWISSNYIAAFAMSDYAANNNTWQQNVTTALLKAKSNGFEDT